VPEQLKARDEAAKLLRQVSANASASATTAKKAKQAEQLFAEIGKIQASKVIKGKSPPAQTEHDISGDQSAHLFAERIMRLEGEQNKARLHIQQLINAKRKLEKARKQELEKETREQQEYNRKLQAKLTHLIAEKEKEYKLLVEEITNVKTLAASQAEKLRCERDQARTIVDQKKAAEEERSGPVEYHTSNLPLILLLGALLVLAGGGVYTFFPQWFVFPPSLASKPTTSTKSTEQETTPVAKAPEPPPKPKPKVLSEYQDPLRTGGNGPVMIELSGGSFKMGVKPSMPYSGELPQLEITLQSFSISKYEITFEEYDRFAKETNRPPLPDGGWGRGTRPVINVTWEDARSYTNWLSAQTGKSYRLPYEREWELAAKANTDSLYWWGGDAGKNNTNCANCGSQWDLRQTAPVGSFKANAFGLHDVIGNVLEWTQNCRYLNYAGAPEQGNRRDGGDCSKRMVRGGSFRTYSNNLRVTRRTAYNPEARNDDLGFRVVRSY